jgi:cytoskeletal protein CcmA (bactofilin family)
MFNSKDNTPTKNISTSSASKLDTLLGSNTEISGDIKFNGVLHLDGCIKGSLSGSKSEDVLTISESGFVEGKIEVANIIINGRVKGDIFASGKIEVASKADIEGNVHYRNIEMETGSKINGQLIYQDKGSKVTPIKKEEKKTK